MKQKVGFGESFRLVGNQPLLGNWDPKKGAAMEWTDGNIWKFETHLPVGADIKFKVVKTGDGGTEVWEEGDNRSFKILGPDYGLTLACQWGRPADMKVEVFSMSGQPPRGEQGGAGASNGVPQASNAGSRAQSPASSVDGDGRSASRSSIEDSAGARGAWVGGEPQFVRSRVSAERQGVWRSEGLSGVARQVVEGDRDAASWLKKLTLQKRLLVDEPAARRPGVEALAALYCYATWVNNGALPCAESGSHYRPNHHANMALEMFRSLEWVLGDAASARHRSPAGERLILAARRMHTRLPAFSGEFRQSVPLTRIRDIAHRNDIPKDLKDEIKHTLQNKLHRSAGPEDLVATEAMLARVTASPGQYSAAFVSEFEIFTRELREFFNATGLVDLVNSTMAALDEPHAHAVRHFVNTKERVEALGTGAGAEDLQRLLHAATEARSFYATLLIGGLRNDCADDSLAMRQRCRLADVRLEEYCFVVLGRLVGELEDKGLFAKLPRANNLTWQLPLMALTTGLRHMGMSLYAGRELWALEEDLRAWHETSPLIETRDAALRAKASLERCLRLTQQYGDMCAEVYGKTARQLGGAFGLPEHMGSVFAESEVRASVAYPVSRLAAGMVRALREAAGLGAWDVLVPGEATGVLVEAPHLQDAAAALSSSHNGNGAGGDDGVVLVVRRAEGDEELGPLGPRLRGVVLLQQLPHLSHLGVRARQERVPFATCDDEDAARQLLRPLLGRRVTLAAAEDGGVTLREAGAGAAGAAPAKRAPAAAARPAAAAAAAAADGAAMAAVSAAFKSGKWEQVVLPLERATVTTCGSKAAACAGLAQLAAASNGLFATPRGAALPFGAMEAAVEAAGGSAAARFPALLAKLDDPRVSGEELEAACAEMRALVGGLEVPAGLVKQIQSAFDSSALLAVRSSASVEDLAGMAAAGLYDSVVGVEAAEAGAVGAAVAAVWASLFTRRAVLSRRSAGVSSASSRMGCLLMEAVAPDYSFVLHTARPRDGDARVLMAEVAPGQGETLASGVRGTPWRFEVDKAAGAVTTAAFANFSTQLVLPKRAPSPVISTFATYGSGAATAVLEPAAASTSLPGAALAARGGALVEREVVYSALRLSRDADWRKAVVQRLAAVGGAIEAAAGGVAQDIEGGVVVGEGDKLTVHIFQTRPQ